jgi:hypothetical protein
MSTATYRITARFLRRLADLVGDPEELFRKLADAKAEIDALQLLMPEVLEGEQLIEENYRYRWSPPPDKKDAIKKLEDAEFKMSLGQRTVLRHLGEVGRSIFLAILQKYSLPAGVRKKVEAQAKAWGRSRPIKFKGRASEVQLGIKSLVDSAYEVAKEALATGKPTEGSEAEVAVGSFKLVNTGGFSAEVMAGVTEALEKGEKLLRSKGFGKTCYGEVYVTRTLSGTALAFYVLAQDALFVRANFRKPMDLVYNIVHELAHRLDHKFLKSKEPEKNRLYRDLSWKARSHKPDVELPKEGEIIEIAKKPFEVHKVGYSKIYIKAPGSTEPPKEYITVAQYSKIKARREGKPPFGPEGFVTEYASKNADENFAEMVTNYCLGRLSPKLTEALEALVG